MFQYSNVLVLCVPCSNVLMFYDLMFYVLIIAWKVSKYGAFSGPYFCTFGMNTDWTLRISPYLVQMRKNTDQKKLHIWTLFTQLMFYCCMFQCCRILCSNVLSFNVLCSMFYFQVFYVLSSNILCSSAQCPNVLVLHVLVLYVLVFWCSMFQCFMFYCYVLECSIF